MIGNDDCRTYVEHMRIEHSHLDQSLEQFQHLLENAEALPPENLFLQLLEKLNALRQQLAHHFRDEEEGGCMDEARSRSPCLSEDVHALQAEHAGFLATLDKLIAQANALTKESGLPALKQSFHDLAQELHAHEAEENRILLFGFGSPAMETLST